MKIQSAYLLAIVATIVLGVVGYLKLCNYCFIDQNLEADVQNKSITPATPVPLHPLSVADSLFSIKVDDNFNFKSSEPSFLMPVPLELKRGILEIKEHLDANPNKIIQITGIYASSEINNSDFPDLGLARANSVKNHFVMLGVPSSQLLTESKMEEDMAITENILYGPVAYRLMEKLPAANESQPQ